MRWPSYKPSYKTASAGLCFQRKSSKALKKSEEVSVTSVYPFYMLCSPCTHTHCNTLQHMCHGFSSRQGNWFVQNALIFGTILRYIDLKKSGDLDFFRHFCNKIFRDYWCRCLLPATQFLADSTKLKTEINFPRANLARLFILNIYIYIFY